MGRTSTIYLIHFDTPLHHARHYMGSTSNLKQRLESHSHPNGNGSKLMRAVAVAGISWRVVRTWPGGRDRERQMKTQGAGKYCPLCREKPRGTRPKDYIDIGERDGTD
jgi:hypothetical protein